MRTGRGQAKLSLYQHISTVYQSLTHVNLMNSAVVLELKTSAEESEDVADKASSDAFNALETAASWLKKQPKCSTICISKLL